METKQTYWISNICNRNVSLADLNLTIKAYSSINLLDNKHYQYTKEQIDQSVLFGSIFNKRDKIVVRKTAPAIIKMNAIKILDESGMPSRERSIYLIKEEVYDELNMSDEEFIKENF